MKKYFLLIIMLISVSILSACNEPNLSFVISFDSNGGTIVESITYDGDSTITIPDNPTKAGFIFDGWFWDNGTFEVPFTANSLLDIPIEDDLTVYAKWVEQDDELTMQLKNIYLLAVQVNAFQGTYEEWLETVRGLQGVPGEDGKSSLLRVNQGVLEWQLEGDSSWKTLFDLNNLVGSDGIDSKNIVLKLAEGYIQWQYSGDTTWTNLVELTTLVGPAGADGVNGTDGKQVTFQVSAGFIQWQYVGDTLWNNLIDLATITGADGTNGTDGVDGREVLFQVAEGYIQWQYSGDTLWTNLVDVNTITGVQGVGIVSTSINEYGELIITYTDNTVVNIGTIYKIYTVNFIGPDGYLIDTQNVIYGSDAIAPIAPIIEGYTFTGWSQNLTNIVASISINAIYQIITYTVTFETKGGLAIDLMSNVEYGSTIVLPIPVKEGFVFTGWYYGEDINSGQFTSQSYVEDNLILYARWAINEYTVTFNSNGGTSVESQVVEDNNKAIKPLDPTRVGYTFLGWFINGDEKWVFGGYDVTQNITLIAHWSINSYTVTYVQNNDQENMTLIVNPFTELIQPIKVGYAFAGWFTTIDYEENAFVDTMPAENVILYAKWDIVNYQIYYVLDGAENNAFNPSTYTIVTNTINLNNPTKEGYSFMGWYSEDTYINEVTAITLGSTGDVTLYAKWESFETLSQIYDAYSESYFYQSYNLGYFDYTQIDDYSRMGVISFIQPSQYGNFMEMPIAIEFLSSEHLHDFIDMSEQQDDFLNGITYTMNPNLPKVLFFINYELLYNNYYYSNGYYLSRDWSTLYHVFPNIIDVETPQEVTKIKIIGLFASLQIFNSFTFHENINEISAISVESYQYIVDERNMFIQSYDGSLYNFGLNELIKFKRVDTIDTIVNLPLSVTTIRSLAFHQRNINYLINIHSSVTTIGHITENSSVTLFIANSRGVTQVITRSYDSSNLIFDSPMAVSILANPEYKYVSFSTNQVGIIEFLGEVNTSHYPLDPDLVIPSYIDLMEVTHIFARAYRNINVRLNKISIPNSVIYIGDRALPYSYFVYIPISVNYIGELAIYSRNIALENTMVPTNFEFQWYRLYYDTFDDINIILNATNQIQENHYFRYVVLNNNEAYILKYLGVQQEIIEINILDGYIVTGIGSNVFDNNDLNEMHLSKWVSYVSDYVIYDYYYHETDIEFSVYVVDLENPYYYALDGVLYLK